MKKSRYIAIILAVLLLATCIPAAASGSVATPIAMTQSADDENLYYSMATITSAYQNMYFKVTLTTEGPYTIFLTWNQIGGADAYTALPSDLDLDMYGASQNHLKMSHTGGTTPEYITFTVANGTSYPPGTYYFQVYAYGGSYNPSAQFKLLLVGGDAKMFTEAARYRDYNLYPWYNRASAGDTTGVPVTQGAPYSFGNKLSIQTIANNNANAYADASKPLNAWSKYATGAGKKRPGLFMDEYVSYNNNPTQYPQYNPALYYGIDCSGLIQRAAQAAVTYGVNTYKIAQLSPVQDNGLGSYGSFGLGTYDTPATDVTIKTGSIVVFTGHVFMISRVNVVNPKGLSKAMGAETSSPIPPYSQRKVIEYDISKHAGKS